MKRKTLYRILAVLVTATMLFAACTKDTADVKLAPTLATSQISSITADSATVVGFVVAAGDGFTERGICYNTAPTPDITGKKTVYTGQNKTATFSVRLTGLTRLTKYYARAYATNVNSTIYGEELTFNTVAALPAIANINPSVLANTLDKGVTATTAVNITDDGGPDATANITSRGVVYSFSTKPTIKNSFTTEGTGKGQFTSLATNLLGNKKYYLRAYATNKIGTTYSNEINFTTPVAYATVKTDAATKIGKTLVTFNGVVTYNGGGTISSKGFCYSMSPNPTISDTKVPVVTAKDSITTNVTGLTSNTAYHVRAYVTNETGTNYGVDVPFSTLADITKLWIVGDYNGWDNSDNAKFILSTLTSNGDAEGYAYLKSGGIKLVTDHSWSDPATFGDGGGGKLTHPGGNISVPADGYYLIKANIGTMTYSLTQTTWGIIGDATTGGWGTQTNMVYDPTTLTFQLAAHLTAGGGSFKFRGTSDWGINYGIKAGISTLVAGGDNIPVDLESDYAITLDLSHPNAYTYSANRWGVIGDATPGGWDTDTNMTWDATNKVFKVTLDLTAKSFKFRANDAWTVNVGGSLDALVQDGGNLSVASAGNYTITLNPWTLKATITKN
jgi:hypothetical protein